MRVECASAWARGLGYEVVRLESEGMEALVKRKKAWPRNGMQFCTQELKIFPAQRWLDSVAPGGDVVCVVGVRRCESARRATWPEWQEESEAHGGRSCWAPLVMHDDAARDLLLARAEWEVLPHRSQECYPCVNSSRADLREVDEERVSKIERIEGELGVSSTGKPKTMFRPAAFMGAVGIREIARWARSERGAFEPQGPGAGCDSGMCAS